MSIPTPVINVETSERAALERVAAPVEAKPVARRWRLADVARNFPTLSSGALSILDQAIVSGTSFVTAVIINRTVSAVEVGIYYVTLSIVIIALGVQENAIVAPYVIYSKRRQGASWPSMLAVHGCSILR